jgi:hypothetical protein
MGKIFWNCSIQPLFLNLSLQGFFHSKLNFDYL